MSYKPGDGFDEWLQTATFAGGAANADALPTAVLKRNGTTDGAVVCTVVGVATGQYNITGVIPAGYTSGDVVSLVATSIMGGLTFNETIFNEIIDGVRQNIDNPTAASIAIAVWAAGARTLTSFGTLATDAATAVWAAGARTLTSFGTLVADTSTAVWAAVSRTLTSGAAPSAAAVADAVWDEALAGHVAAGSTGLALSGASAPSAASVADAVWDELLAGHAIAGSAGAGLSAAGAAGDPWATLLPGSYAANTAGYIIGTYLDTPLSDCCPDSGCTSATCDCSGPLGTYAL